MATRRWTHETSLRPSEESNIRRAINICSKKLLKSTAHDLHTESCLIPVISAIGVFP